MNEAVRFLRDCGTFYLATEDGDQPRVRPFGAVMEYEGKIYLSTSNTKNVFHQMKKNPKVEIAAAKDGGEFRGSFSEKCHGIHLLVGWKGTSRFRVRRPRGAGASNGGSALGLTGTGLPRHAKDRPPFL